VIQVVQLAERLPANRALLSFIPLRDNIPDQAVLGVDFDLLQAFLVAILVPRANASSASGAELARTEKHPQQPHPRLCQQLQSYKTRSK
jgi:hypothetical protein